MHLVLMISFNFNKEPLREVLLYYVTDEKTEAKRLRNLPSLAKLKSSIFGIGNQAV